MVMGTRECMCFESFVEKNPHAATGVGDVVDLMVNAFPGDQFMDFVDNPSIEDLFAEYKAHVKNRNENN